MPKLPTIVVRLLLSAALAVALGGCSSDSEPDGPKVIQPGAPGEPNASGDPDTAAQSNEWNHTDVAFMQMMIPHHHQALEMSDLAGKHARSKAVRTLAERISGSQAPEIQAMSAWLDERKMEVPRAGEDPMKYDHSQHGHNSMMGMMTPAQMKKLSAARGEQFDRLFLRGMIRHHAGAVDMAEDAAQDGSDMIVGEMTADVAATQSAEIGRMQDILTRL
ncbi:DUF305 domain-containing protein [Aeromicrobium sp.]|uniref:DUF305 domain-containing protein n=1 Tax=Aeromicrobium sp. TaxID=1871063 RepID=UPI003D6B821B